MHILVVDDDQAIRITVAEILELEGHSVAQAQHGRAALEEIWRRPPDLIFLDMRMPVMDGWTFAATYRSLPGPHAPIVCMTAAADASDRCREINADGCLSKPFDLGALLACVEEPVHAHALLAA